MEKDDLETYQVQLSQVEVALQADPSNAELASLKSELSELIALTKAALAQSAAASSSSLASSSKAKAGGTAPAKKAFVAGDECLAKYSGDGQWYAARVASVGGAAENRQYSVVFRGYNSTEIVNASQIKALPSNYSGPGIGGGGGGSGAIGGGGSGGAKRKLSKEEEEERERKKKKNEKKLENKAAKAKEQTEKQATWQKFAKKSERKGIHIAGVSGTSIFKTPDNPLGRVGVTGSGKGMTEVKLMGKHKFDQTQEKE
ncbi:hypothetical protein BDW22DRAFT_92839 [Trametopsis cervina]|nr:hypothetical protein BDW22DRAFT_92839 [Trametopsis cervina]